MVNFFYLFIQVHFGEPPLPVRAQQDPCWAAHHRLPAALQIQQAIRSLLIDCIKGFLQIDVPGTLALFFMSNGSWYRIYTGLETISPPTSPPKMIFLPTMMRSYLLLMHLYLFCSWTAIFPLSFLLFLHFFLSNFLVPSYNGQDSSGLGGGGG